MELAWCCRAPCFLIDFCASCIDAFMGGAPKVLLRSFQFDALPQIDSLFTPFWRKWKLSPATLLEHHQTELLSEVIERMNDLFVDDGLSENDMVNYANTIIIKVSENDVVMDQIRNNSK